MLRPSLTANLAVYHCIMQDGEQLERILRAARAHPDTTFEILQALGPAYRSSEGQDPPRKIAVLLMQACMDAIGDRSTRTLTTFAMQTLADLLERFVWLQEPFLKGMAGSSGWRSPLKENTPSLRDADLRLLGYYLAFQLRGDVSHRTDAVWCPLEAELRSWCHLVREALKEETVMP